MVAPMADADRQAFEECCKRKGFSPSDAFGAAYYDIWLAACVYKQHSKEELSEKREKMIHEMIDENIILKHNSRKA